MKKYDVLVICDGERQSFFHVSRKIASMYAHWIDIKYANKLVSMSKDSILRACLPDVGCIIYFAGNKKKK